MPQEPKKAAMAQNLAGPPMPPGMEGMQQIQGIVQAPGDRLRQLLQLLSIFGAPRGTPLPTPGGALGGMPDPGIGVPVFTAPAGMCDIQLPPDSNGPGPEMIPGMMGGTDANGGMFGYATTAPRQRTR